MVIDSGLKLYCCIVIDLFHVIATITTCFISQTLPEQICQVMSHTSKIITCHIINSAIHLPYN